MPGAQKGIGIFIKWSSVTIELLNKVLNEVQQRSTLALFMSQSLCPAIMTDRAHWVTLLVEPVPPLVSFNTISLLLRMCCRTLSALHLCPLVTTTKVCDDQRVSCKVSWKWSKSYLSFVMLNSLFNIHCDSVDSLMLAHLHNHFVLKLKKICLNHYCLLLCLLFHAVFLFKWMLFVQANSFLLNDKRFYVHERMPTGCSVKQ